MSKIILVVMLVLSLSIGVSIAGEGLVSPCITDALSSCKLTNNSVDSKSMQKYEKAFSCIRHGSDRGDKFDVGFSVFEKFSLNFGSDTKARYSFEECTQEIKKLNDVRFVEEMKETFSDACGKVVLGTTQACLEAAVRLGTPHAQEFKCSASQRSNSIVINNIYGVGFNELPSGYKIKSVVGVSGIQCDEGAYAGVNNYNSLFCALPDSYKDSKLVVTLGNGITCSVDVSSNISRAPKDAKRHSCANVFNSLPGGADVPMLMKASIVGLCDLCLDQNLGTPDYDQRSLSNRVQGCAIWAATASAESGASTCAVKVTSNAGSVPQFPTAIFSGFPTPSIGGALVLPTAPGTERGDYFSMALNDQSMASPIWVASLCNARKEGEVVEFGGAAWKKIPNDYLGSVEGKQPQIEGMINEIKKITGD